MTDKPELYIPGQLRRANKRGSDRCMTLSFLTRELESGELEMWNEFLLFDGYIGFTPDSYQKMDFPEDDLKIKGESPSKKLRNTLYVLHREKGIEEDFEVWYVKEMKKIQQTYLDKINDLQI